jgi:hypothetical protein
MENALLLTDEIETTRLMLNDIAFEELPVRDEEARAGCNCDRWGHPRPDCADSDFLLRAETPVSSPVEQ